MVLPPLLLIKFLSLYRNSVVCIFRDVEFISLCSDDDGDRSDDIEMNVVSLGGKRSRLVAMDTLPPPKRSRITIPPLDPNDLSFNPLDQTAIHPASFHIATA